MTLAELWAWVARETDPARKCEKAFFLEAATAMGSGSVENRLIRLMVWVGARFRSSAEHSRSRVPLEIMVNGTAWCDQCGKIFLLMAWQLLGVVGRELALAHSDGTNGHTVVEVEYGGAWHLFDAHGEHQAVYRNPQAGYVLSYAGVVAHPEVVVAEGHWWRGADGVGKEGFYRAGSLAITSAPSNESIIYTHMPWHDEPAPEKP